MKIWINCTIPRPVRERLEALGELVGRCDEPEVIFTNPNNLPYKLTNISIPESVKVICTASTGLTHIDMDYCREAGIAVLSITNDPVLSQITSTAEHALGLMIAAVRHYPAAFAQVQAGLWDWEAIGPGRQLSELTVGIVGSMGRLGNMMRHYCLDVGMAVHGYDRRFMFDLPVAWFVPLDVVSLHIPAEGNHGYVNAERFFNHMKPGAVLVNTSRGEVVDELDLLAWLDRDPAAVYAADVITNEQTRDSLVWRNRRNPQIILTPHIGGSTTDAMEIAYMRAVEKLEEHYDTL